MYLSYYFELTMPVYNVTIRKSVDRLNFKILAIPFIFDGPPFELGIGNLMCFSIKFSSYFELFSNIYVTFQLNSMKVLN